MLFYKFGAADEPLTKSGIAHYLEHLMFKNLDESGNPVDFSAKVAAVGGKDNAFTSWDYIAYYQVVPKQSLPMVMELEASRMDKLQLADENTELGVILEERLLRVDNNPQARLEEAGNATLFANHPYKRPIIGWRGEMETLTLADALEFHRDYYKPANAFLVLCGDLSLAEAKTLAERYYGKIQKEPAHLPPVRPKEPSWQPPKRVELISSEVQSPSWSRQWLLPKDAAMEPSWRLISQMLNAPKNGRLYQVLVKTGVAVEAYAWFGDYLKDYAKFTIGAIPATGTSLEELEKAVEELVADFTLAPPEQEQNHAPKQSPEQAPQPLEGSLERAKAKLIGDTLYAQDGVLSPAYRLGIALASGKTIEDVLAEPERLRLATLPQLAKLWAEGIVANSHNVTLVAQKADKQIPQTTQSPQAANQEAKGANTPQAANQEATN